MPNARVIPIKWPIDGSDLNIRIEEKYYRRIMLYQPNDYINLATVHEVLNNPNRIFAGLNRPVIDSSEWKCVVGKPKNWFMGTDGDITAPFPRNLVYLVFLNDRYSLIGFYAYRADSEDPLSPEGWRDRFVERIWKRPS